MAKMKPEAAQSTWADVEQVVAEWSAEYGIDVVVQIGWKRALSTGAYVEVVISEGGTVGRGAELQRTREAFPARRMSGQAGAVLWALSAALRALENEPWQWSRKMRRDAQNKL